ncbi:MAG: SAM-dependent DNA methyltransferase [Tetrasphaera sp.]|nr:SAM-dependent DNA methyltransferase [Tetrasphaera sp.]
MRTRTPQPRTAREQHRAWLELVDTEGPFLALPVLTRVWKQGITPMEPSAKAALVAAKPAFDAAWDRWDRARGDEPVLAAYRAARDSWVETVLREVFGWGELWSPGDALAASAIVRSPDGRVMVSPTGVLRHEDRVGALVWVVDPVGGLREPSADGWAESVIDRMELMLRSASLPIGLVTDGRWWGLVSAPEKSLAASGVVDAQTWVEEPATRDALAELLSVRHLVGGAEHERLPQLFVDSVLAAEQITEALGAQVRKAVELVVAAFAESAAEAVERGDADPLPDDGDLIYEAVVTVLMRVVLLLFAEERGLLPQGQLYSAGYGISDQLMALATRAQQESESSLDSTHLTWHRLLSTSQALYTGASFEDMRLPAYGGSLFDPQRFPFLTATTDRGTLALTVSDRVMLKVLDAVQTARVKGEEPRRISFRDIDVEQIGYIYEGLLGYTCRRADRVVVGLMGKDGAEPEIPLDTLDELFEEQGSDSRVTAAMVAWVKSNQPAAAPSSAAALAKALARGDQLGDADLALRHVTRDEDLRSRLRPWIGVIRRDLRDRPVVVEPGGWLVVETPSRRNAGAHYTPRALAEQVVLHALEPIVYAPGPHQTPDREQRRLKTVTELLDLKIADIACGSGAFLVAAARYLAARVIEACRAEGIEGEKTAHELEVWALREVVAHCLYGADINAMAVEMCKLSLWLVSLDPGLPFSFVDDKVLQGNSLLGLTDLRQLEALHINPAPKAMEQGMFQLSGDELVERLDLDHRIQRAISLRRRLSEVIDNDDPQRSAHAKTGQMRQLHDLMSELRLVADGVIAAGLPLGGKPGKKLDEAYDNLRQAVGQALPRDPVTADATALESIIATGLTPTVPTDYERWEPLHWCLEVPDVMERGGFDAVIGNPPFLGGQKLTGAMGTNIRDWFVSQLAEGTKGSADLVAYFFLRAQSLLTSTGTLGLIATNTLAQGDTREVGLDQMVASGFTITRAIQSRSWPAKSANLEYAAVWGGVGRVAEESPRVCDDVVVGRVSTLLEAEGRVSGQPVRLAENAGIAFQGCIVLGMGFVLQPEEAAQWIDADPRNAEVLFPYLNGEDLNSRPDCSASRWVIDFNDRTEAAAREYELPMARVEQDVRPERVKNVRAARRDLWWRFAENAAGMRKAIANLGQVLVIAQTSNTLMCVRQGCGQILSHMLVVFATSSYADQAVLSSSVHQLWIVQRGSGLRGDPRYIPSDVFATFPRPIHGEGLDLVGRELDEQRREIMVRRQLGLTKLYNLVNDPDLPDSADADVARMRQIHVDLDLAVMAAYGWDDVPLDHGFHTYRQMTRWTVSPAARVEILDRLLEENHRRAALEGDATPALDDDDAVGES